MNKFLACFLTFSITALVFLPVKSPAQKNLYLENTATGKFHLIKSGKKLRLIVKGYDRKVKAKLIAVSDSGITLNGKFITNHVTNKEEHFVNLNDIYAMRRISTLHIISRAAGCAAIFSIGVGALSYIDDLKNDPELKNDSESDSGYVLDLLFLAAGSMGIPFYIPARYLPLNDQWKLRIK